MRTYEHSTTDLAERLAQILKIMSKKSNEPISQSLDKFLFKYRVTPHSTTGVSPAELLFKRKLRCRLNLLNPYECVGNKVSKQQEAQKRNYSTCPRNFNAEPKSNVVVRNYGLGSKWIPGVVEEKTGPVSYRCRLEDGSQVRRHQDQIISGSPQKDIESPKLGPPVGFEFVLPKPPSLQGNSPSPVEVLPAPTEQPNSPVASTPQSQNPPIRRSSRRVNAPDRLNYH